MPSFDDLKELFSKAPVWRCPNCGERDRAQFAVTFELTYDSEVDEIDDLDKTMFLRWNDVDSDTGNYGNPTLYCRACGKDGPLPRDWKLVMR